MKLAQVSKVFLVTLAAGIVLWALYHQFGFLRMLALIAGYEDHIEVGEVLLQRLDDDGLEQLGLAGVAEVDCIGVEGLDAADPKVGRS